MSATAFPGGAAPEAPGGHRLTVRAAVCPAYGPPEVVRVDELPAPVPAAGQVVVRVGAAAVNFPDVLLVAGTYQVKVPPPFVPGSEFAGVVTAVGDGVAGIALGDRVTGTGMVGAFAEEVAVGTRGLRVIPPGCATRTAAAFGVAHRTAQHALRTVAGLRPGERVIVLGAGGGVGLAAVQLAALLGAEVTAVASSAEKLAAATAAGAVAAVDHRAGDLRPALRAALPDGADVVIDPVGGDLSEPALRALRPGGRFVTVGYAAGAIPRLPLNLVLVKDVTVAGVNMANLAARAPEAFRRHEDELAALLADGRITPHIDTAYPLAETAAALRRLADGRAVGKVVIDVDADI
jgi:NADPH2:quinone reductase